MTKANTRLRALTFEDLSALKGIKSGRGYLNKLAKAGKFPRPFKLTENRNAWFERDIDAWLLQRAAIAAQGRPRTAAATDARRKQRANASA